MKNALYRSKSHFPGQNLTKIHQYKKQTTQKTNKRTTVRTIPRETKKGRPKKGQKMHNSKGPKRGRPSLSHGKKLFH
jgi:hypothetical protein